MLTCGELIKMLQVFPADKPVAMMGWYSIIETDDPEEIHSVAYLKEVDIDTLEVIGEITDFVAIISEKYSELAGEFP